MVNTSDQGSSRSSTWSGEGSCCGSGMASPQYPVEGSPAEGGLDLVRQRRDLKVLFLGSGWVAVETLVEAVAQLRPIRECEARAVGCRVLAEAGPAHDGRVPRHEAVCDRVEVRTQHGGNLRC